MTMTKKQRRDKGLDRPAPPPAPGALPWKARDILRQFPDGHSELIAWAVFDANGNQIIEDFHSVELRDGVVAAANLHRSAFGQPLDPRAAYLDPMSILQDALDVLPVVLEEREEANGEKDPVFRDLIKRVKLVMKGA